MASSAVPLEIDCVEVKSMLDRGESMILIDCREQDEWDLVHIPEAQLVPMSQISEQLNELEPHRDARVVIHCHHGGRSMRVASWLRQQGFSQAQSMAGGIDGWAERIDPSLARY